MRRWIFLVLGVLLAIVGVLWIGQGLNMLGQSGGMNGQHIWAFIGLVCAVAGLAFIAASVRAGRAARRPRAR
jgi:type VI protein secretion system component VasK